MTNTNRHIAKTSKDLSLLASSKNKKSGQYIPKRINPEIFETSPVFKTPHKWVSKFKFIDESKRIQSYKPLEESCLSYILASPPRMSHATRTVIPRDLLLPFRVMKNPTVEATSDNAIEYGKKTSTSAKPASFKYIIAPFHPNENKVAEDPVTYYPKDLSIFNNYTNDKSSNDVVPLKKFSLNITLYPNISDWKTVGWHKNTGAVVEKIYTEKVIELLKDINSVEEKETDKVILFATNGSETLGITDGTITVNINQITKNNAELGELLKKKFPNNYIPKDKLYTNAANELIIYCILIDYNIL